MEPRPIDLKHFVWHQNAMYSSGFTNPMQTLSSRATYK